MAEEMNNSHKFPEWALALAEEGETIPPGVALLGREELTEHELRNRPHCRRTCEEMA